MAVPTPPGRRGLAGPIAALLGLAIVWGGSVPLTKLGLRDFPPLTLTALRYLVAAPCFMLLLLGRPLPPPRALSAAAALGVLGIVVGQVSQTFGVLETSASVATVISATIPILVVVFAAVRLHQPIQGGQAAGLALAFAGVGLVATGDPRRLVAALGAPAIKGDILMVLSAAAVALYYVLSLDLIGRYSVTMVAGLTSMAGALGLAPLAAWELRHTSARLTVQGIAVVLYLAVLVTVAGLWIWLRALQRLPVGVAAALQYLQPLVGVTASAVLFGDPLGGWFLAGTGLVLAGIAWSTSVLPRGTLPSARLSPGTAAPAARDSPARGRRPGAR